jgi:hypothetical protein
MSSTWNFARRPFRNERPVLLLTGVTLLAALVLLVANVRLYADFSRESEGSRKGIAYLEERRDRARKAARDAQTVLNNYKLSALASESAGLQALVRERRFSWIGLLAHLERTLPAEVRLARLAPRFESADDVTLDLAVVGRSPESVVRTVSALSRDPRFRAVELRSETTPEAGLPEGYTFQLSIRYLPEGPS